jgi:hypothetical protein
VLQSAFLGSLLRRVVLFHKENVPLFKKALFHKENVPLFIHRCMKSMGIKPPLLGTSILGPAFLRHEYTRRSFLRIQVQVFRDTTDERERT